MRRTLYLEDITKNTNIDSYDEKFLIQGLKNGCKFDYDDETGKVYDYENAWIADFRSEEMVKNDFDNFARRLTNLDYLGLMGGENIDLPEAIVSEFDDYDFRGEDIILIDREDSAMGGMLISAEISIQFEHSDSPVIKVSVFENGSVMVRVVRQFNSVEGEK